MGNSGGSTLAMAMVLGLVAMFITIVIQLIGPVPSNTDSTTTPSRDANGWIVTTPSEAR